MMKVRLSLVLFIVLELATVNSFAQQQITVTTTDTNNHTTASRVIIDMPGLANNPNAIIIATPTGNTRTINPHPIGAWYVNNKWHIFNTDHATLPMGATFQVEVFLNPDANHYLHVVVTANNQTVPRTALNHPGLDFHPEAQVKIFQNHDPYTRNPSEAKVYFDNSARKWFIENVDGKPLKPNTAYNVVIGSPPGGTPIGISPVSLATQTTISPTGNAGGDLNGNYPNPNVVGLNGRPLSNKTPTVGDVLRWNGTAWEPVTINNGIISANGGGQNGQVLTSNGAGSPPTWKPLPSTTSATPSAAPMQTFFKESNAIAVSVMHKSAIQLPELTHSITLAKKSRIIISGMVVVFGQNCTVNCSGSQGSFTVSINGNLKFELPVGVSPNQWLAFTITNFMIDLEAGNYTIVFGLKNDLQRDLSGRAKQSSIMIMPL